MIRYSAEALIKTTGLEIGFSAIGIARVRPSAESNAAYDAWISAGRHGDMRYLEDAPKRRAPGRLLNGARSVISVAVNYYSSEGAAHNEERAAGGEGVFSMYAHGRDYHSVLGEMLQTLRQRLGEFFPRMRSIALVDTQPISERDYAIQSGIAWLGKNTCVISPQLGSWIFLGELITNLELEPDVPLSSLCGRCSRCMDACPTGALREAFTLDARRCIAYLTIEKRGDIDGQHHTGIGDHLFGCDICQEVCPFNRQPQESAAFGGQPRSAITNLTLDEIVAISDAAYRALTRDSAISRCKAEGMRRNAAIVNQNVSRRQRAGGER